MIKLTEYRMDGSVYCEVEYGKNEKAKVARGYDGEWIGEATRNGNGVSFERYKRVF